MDTSVVNTHYVDNVIKLLNKYGWYEEPDLVVKGQLDRPVFSRKGNKRTYKIVVGLLWTTYYDIQRDSIGDIDSIKTEDYLSIEAKIIELTNKK